MSGSARRRGLPVIPTVAFATVGVASAATAVVYLQADALPPIDEFVLGIMIVGGGTVVGLLVVAGSVVVSRLRDAARRHGSGPGTAAFSSSPAIAAVHAVGELDPRRVRSVGDALAAGADRAVRLANDPEACARRLVEWLDEREDVVGISRIVVAAAGDGVPLRRWVAQIADAVGDRGRVSALGAGGVGGPGALRVVGPVVDQIVLLAVAGTAGRVELEALVDAGRGGTQIAVVLLDPGAADGAGPGDALHFVGRSVSPRSHGRGSWGDE